MTLAESQSKDLTYQQLLDSDTHEVNPTLRLTSDVDFGTMNIPVERYLSQEFFDLEVEKIWKKAWQMACREEHIPNVGDTYVYDIVGTSILLVRSAPNEIKAFYNACLHRGRQLRECSGHAGDVIRCPFHALAWHLDGSLENLTTAWDFPQVEPENFSLPEVKVATWEGWVFINMDPKCQDFNEYIGDLPMHFEKWAPHKKFVSAHVAKRYPVNWKVAQEAFMEAFHVIATHPQILAGTGDCNSQYDVFGNFSRAITPNGTPSPHLQWDPTEQEIFDAITDKRLDEEPMATIPEGMTARAFAAQVARERLRSAVPDVDTYCDAEINDSMYFTLFPNFHPWGAFNRINYRFRPVGTKVDECLMECIYTEDFEGDERPAPAEYIELGIDQDWTELIPVIGNLARVFHQDSFNLPKVQKGLETFRADGLTLTKYQEVKIRHWHAMAERFIAN